MKGCIRDIRERFISESEMTIKDEKEYQVYRANMENIITKGTKLGDMELLPEEDKNEYIRLSRAVAEYEAVCHPLPDKQIPSSFVI